MPFRRRIKSLYLRSEQYTIKLVGVRKIRGLAVGDTMTLYVSDKDVYKRQVPLL